MTNHREEIDDSDLGEDVEVNLVFLKTDARAKAWYRLDTSRVRALAELLTAAAEFRKTVAGDGGVAGTLHDDDMAGRAAEQLVIEVGREFSRVCRTTRLLNGDPARGGTP